MTNPQYAENIDLRLKLTVELTFKTEYFGCERS